MGMTSGYLSKNQRIYFCKHYLAGAILGGVEQMMQLQMMQMIQYLFFSFYSGFSKISKGLFF